MTKQTEARRLADWLDANSSGVYRPAADAAALLRRQDELLEQALEALEMLFPFEINVKQQDAFAAIRKHLEAK